MFCTKCGKDNGDNNKFCIECGATLGAPNVLQEAVEPEPVAEEPVVEQEYVAPTGKGSDKGTTILGDQTKLKLVDGKGNEYCIKDFPAIVGKGSASDVIIPGDESISRQHFCIHENGSESFVIEDLNSTNRTYLNGNVLEPEELVVLNDEGKITIGETLLTVVYVDRL